MILPFVLLSASANEDQAVSHRGTFSVVSAEYQVLNRCAASLGFCRRGVCEAHPSPPQGARVRGDLQPGAARRAGRSQRAPAGRARAEEAGRLGHLPELQPQGRQVQGSPETCGPLV